MTIIALSEEERKLDVPSDTRISSGLGRALHDATTMLTAHFPAAMTVGSQFDLTRTAALVVVGKACEVDSRMTVRELFNLLSTGRR